jgi:hypothetical protein
VCNTDEIGWESGTIDFYPYHFLFPKGIYAFRSFQRIF